MVFSPNSLNPTLLKSCHLLKYLNQSYICTISFYVCEQFENYCHFPETIGHRNVIYTGGQERERERDVIMESDMPISQKKHSPIKRWEMVIFKAANPEILENRNTAITFPYILPLSPSCYSKGYLCSYILFQWKANRKIQKEVRGIGWKNKKTFNRNKWKLCLGKEIKHFCFVAFCWESTNGGELQKLWNK